MNKKRLKGNALLLLTALIWGASFVAQSVAMDHIGPFTFNATRMLLGSLVLIPAIFFLDRIKPKDKRPTKEMRKAERKTVLIGGFFCGTALFVAASFQQFGVQHTTVGKAGFITALYMVIVPILGIFLKKKVPKMVWLGVALAVPGMYLLTITESLTINLGDLLMLICALFFSIHILVIDHFSPKVDGVRMSCVQFFVASVYAGIAMLIFESPSLTSLMAASESILYAGALSCGVAYTLQVVAQKDTDPSISSLILSTESVFAVLAGWVVLQQVLSGREILGCVFLFVAVILAQLPGKKDKALR